MDTLFNRSADLRDASGLRRNKLSRGELANFLALNVVPVRATLHFRDGASEFNLTNSDFKNVWYESSHSTGKTVGSICGIALDATAAYLLFHQRSPDTLANFGTGIVERGAGVILVITDLLIVPLVISLVN